MNPLLRNRMPNGGGNPLNNYANMINQFNQFRQSFQNQNPQQIVQSLVNSGRITPQQFEQYKNVAMQLQGILK